MSFCRCVTRAISATSENTRDPMLLSKPDGSPKKLIGNELPIFSSHFRKFYLSISISWRSLSSLGIILRFIKESFFQKKRANRKLFKRIKTYSSIIIIIMIIKKKLKIDSTRSSYNSHLTLTEYFPVEHYSCSSLRSIKGGSFKNTFCLKIANGFLM